MPRGDRSGPERMGPMTGRGLGRCAGSDEPGFEADYPPRGGAGRGRRRGGGSGRGGYGFGGNGGRGWRNRTGPLPTDPLEAGGERRPISGVDLESLLERIRSLEERLAGSERDE